jgi:heterodisulfide reductase subunit A-like polyferredoxin
MKPTGERAEKGSVKAEVIEAMCQGCGVCSASCPTKAIRMQQFGVEQVMAEVETAFSKGEAGGADA